MASNEVRLKSYAPSNTPESFAVSGSTEAEIVPLNTRPEANNTNAPLAVLTPGTVRSNRPSALEATVLLVLVSEGSPGIAGPVVASVSDTPRIVPE